jgi:nucleoredoxin
MSASIVELLGATLQGENGQTSTTDALAGKGAVALYFSAHWCPPCRGFTPKLAEFYKKDLKAKGLEVVFVSSDKDEASFKSYFGEMPWLALPFEDRERKEALSKKYKVKGIPSLVILDGESGETITTDGRSAVMADPEGTDFPWRPKPFSELLGDSFLTNAAGETVGKEALAGKVLGIYFSAHWCPPCRGFTPKLAETYKKMKAKGLNFEVIFASSDRDEAAFKGYYGEMPWLALPHGDKRKEQWSNLFGVDGIPSLAIIDADGTTITKDGRAAVGSDPEGAEFPWHPKPVQDAANPSGINETPSILVFMETQPKEEQARLTAQMTEVAQKYVDAAKKAKEDPKYLFFAATNTNGPVPRIRELTKQEALPPSAHEHPLEEKEPSGGWCCDGCGADGDPTKKRFRCSKGCDFDFCEECNANAGTAVAPRPPVAVLLNLDDSGAYYEMCGDVTTAGLEKFIADFEASALERKQCGE